MSELKYKPGVLIIEGFCEGGGYYGKEKIEKLYDCLNAIYDNFNIQVVLHIYAKDKRFKIYTVEDVVTNEYNDILLTITFYARGFFAAHNIVYKEDQ